MSSSNKPSVSSPLARSPIETSSSDTSSQADPPFRPLQLRVLTLAGFKKTMRDLIQVAQLRTTFVRSLKFDEYLTSLRSALSTDSYLFGVGLNDRKVLSIYVQMFSFKEFGQDYDLISEAVTRSYSQEIWQPTDQEIYDCSLAIAKHSARIITDMVVPALFGASDPRSVYIPGYPDLSLEEARQRRARKNVKGTGWLEMDYWTQDVLRHVVIPQKIFHVEEPTAVESYKRSRFVSDFVDHARDYFGFSATMFKPFNSFANADFLHGLDKLAVGYTELYENKHAVKSFFESIARNLKTPEATLMVQKLEAMNEEELLQFADGVLEPQMEFVAPDPEESHAPGSWFIPSFISSKNASIDRILKGTDKAIKEGTDVLSDIKSGKLAAVVGKQLTQSLETGITQSTIGKAASGALGAAAGLMGLATKLFEHLFALLPVLCPVMLGLAIQSLRKEFSITASLIAGVSGLYCLIYAAKVLMTTGIFQETLKLVGNFLQNKNERPPHAETEESWFTPTQGETLEPEASFGIEDFGIISSIALSLGLRPLTGEKIDPISLMKSVGQTSKGASQILSVALKFVSMFGLDMNKILGIPEVKNLAVEDFAEEVVKIAADSKAGYLLPCASTLAKVRDLHKYGGGMAEALKKAKNEAHIPTIHRMMKLLEDVETAVKQKLAAPQEARPQPVATILKGAPKQGKSLLARFLAQFYFFVELQNVPDPEIRKVIYEAYLAKSSTYVYVKGQDYYYDGVDPRMMVLLLDDWLQRASIKGGDYSPLMDFISAANTEPWFPRCAFSKEDKLCAPKYVLATTNADMFHDETIVEPDAAYRRCDYVFKVSLKDDPDNLKGFDINQYVLERQLWVPNKSWREEDKKKPIKGSWESAGVYTVREYIREVLEVRNQRTRGLKAVKADMQTSIDKISTENNLLKLDQMFAAREAKKGSLEPQVDFNAPQAIPCGLDPRSVKNARKLQAEEASFDAKYDPRTYNSRSTLSSSSQEEPNGSSSNVTLEDIVDDDITKGFNAPLHSAMPMVQPAIMQDETDMVEIDLATSCVFFDDIIGDLDVYVTGVRTSEENPVTEKIIKETSFEVDFGFDHNGSRARSAFDECSGEDLGEIKKMLQSVGMTESAIEAVVSDKALHIKYIDVNGGERNIDGLLPHNISELFYRWAGRPVPMSVITECLQSVDRIDALSWSKVRCKMAYTLLSPKDLGFNAAVPITDAILTEIKTAKERFESLKDGAWKAVEKAQVFIKENWVAIASVIAVVAPIAMWAIFRSKEDDSELDPESQSLFVHKDKVGARKPFVIKKEQVVSPQLGNEDVESVAQALRRNMWSAQSPNTVTGALSDPFGLINFVEENVFHCPAHFQVMIKRKQDNAGLPDRMNYFMLTNVVSGEMRKLNFSDFEILNKDSRENDKAICLITKGKFTAKKVLHHYMSEAEAGQNAYRTGSRMPGVLANDVKSIPVTYKGHGPRTAAYPIFVDGVEEKELIEIKNLFTYSVQTKKGDCGTLLLTADGSTGGKVCGVHILGSSRDGFAYRITADEIKILLAREIATRPPMDELLDSVLIADLKLNDPTKVTVPNCAYDPNIHEFPVNLAVSPPSTTFTSPNLVLFKPDEEPYIPIEFACADTRPSNYPIAREPYCKNIPASEMKQDEFGEILIKISKQVAFELRSVETNLPKRLLTMREALTGFPGTNFKSMDFTTSAGYPFAALGVRKRDIVYVDPEGKLMAGPYFGKFLETVKDGVTMLSHGSCPIWIHQDNLKSEWRAKHKAHKARLVSGAPFDAAVIGRMLFGNFMHFMTDAGMEGETMIGFDPYTQSEEFAQYLMRYGNLKNCGCADYKGYDTDHTKRLILLAIDIINGWYGDEKSVQEQRVLYGESIAESYHIRGPILEQWIGSMPSGNLLTTVINCLINKILVRFAFWNATGRKENSIVEFRDHVVFACLGDDNVMAVAPEFCDRFHELSLQQGVGLLGYTMTSADKDSEVTSELKEPSNVELLKRTLRFEHALHRHVFPLRLSVILEMPLRTKKSHYLAVACGNLENALHELSMHPQAAWDEWYPKMTKFFEPEYVAKSNSRNYYLERVTKTGWFYVAPDEDEE